MIPVVPVTSNCNLFVLSVTSTMNVVESDKDLLVNVCVAVKPAIDWLVDGKVIVVASVPASVRVLLTVRVLLVVPPAIVNPVAAAVSVKALNVDAVRAPEKAPAPVTSSFTVGTVLPIPTSPAAVITKGDVSGFAESSTTKAFPVPV